MRITLLVAAAAAAVSLAAPASAQNRATTLMTCWDGHRDHAPAQVVTACTALIQSGTLASDDLAFVFGWRGKAYLDQNNYAHAIADYSEAIRLDPQKKHFFVGRGAAYAGQKDSTQSLTDYNEALRLDPKYAKALYGRGLEEIALGRKAQGEADIARAKAIDSDVGD